MNHLCMCGSRCKAWRRRCDGAFLVTLLVETRSPSGSPTEKSGFGDARRMQPARMLSVNCKVWWKRNNGLGLFLMVRLGPLVTVKGNLNITAYNDILDDFVATSDFVATVWGRPFPVPA